MYSTRRERQRKHTACLPASKEPTGITDQERKGIEAESQAASYALGYFVKRHGRPASSA